MIPVTISIGNYTIEYENITSKTLPNKLKLMLMELPELHRIQEELIPNITKPLLRRFIEEQEVDSKFIEEHWGDLNESTIAKVIAKKKVRGDFLLSVKDTFTDYVERIWFCNYIVPIEFVLGLLENVGKNYWVNVTDYWLVQDLDNRLTLADLPTYLASSNKQISDLSKLLYDKLKLK
jgi:hypothetical protein